MEFWRWYLKGLFTVLCLKWLGRFLNHSFTILVLSMIILIIGSIFLPMLSPYWLFLSIPIGITGTAYSYWRAMEQELV